MWVVKRDKRKQKVSFDKITSRISKLCYGLDENFIDPLEVAQKVCAGVKAGIATSELDDLAADTAAHLTSKHPDYTILAARIAVSNLHKQTTKSFSATAKILFEYVEKKSGKAAPLLSESVYLFIKENAEVLDSAIIYDRDYNYDYFGYKTLEKSYLFKIEGEIVERPQHLLMRVACGLHCGNLQDTLETYDLMSKGFFTHASPTLFHCGTPRPQLSSCFLLTVKGDSIEGIFSTVTDCALISKEAGGIGLAVHDIRSNGSYIRGSNGSSNGLVPILRIFNNTARAINQGGKRKGAFAVYLEPWHADIFDFLELKKNHGEQELRCRDLFTALWVPDLFMKRVKQDMSWSLFCPNECPGLADVWGDAFETLYSKYEGEGKARKVIKARELWQAILESQQETGNPYMCYKDSANAKSNQQNLGTIRSSNLCTEIMEYTAPDEIAVCNLASIALPKYVDLKLEEFDHQRLFEITQVVTKNLNRIIDINYYPVPEAKKSNFKNRPIAIGVQGLADVFILLRLPYESEKAQKLNKEIFETIYFAALTASNQLAQIHGPYETYEGSPISKGILQFDMWNVIPDSKRWNWDQLRQDIKRWGVRNSLLVAPMPTASTSQILGNNESFEPYTSNIYARRTLAGEFTCVSKHLLKDLIKLGLWTPTLKNKLIASKGSIQKITEIPSFIRSLYKTVWEMNGRTLIDMAADRGAYIDQSQSFNGHMTEISYRKLTSMHFYAWEKGLKTGLYYLRSKPATDPIPFTLDQELLKRAATVNSPLSEESEESLLCTRSEECVTCSS